MAFKNNTMSVDTFAQTASARKARSEKTTELDFIIWNFMKHHPQSKPSFIIKELSLNKGAFYNFVKRNKARLSVDRQLINNQIVSYYSIQDEEKDRN